MRFKLQAVLLLQREKQASVKNSRGFFLLKSFLNKAVKKFSTIFKANSY